MSIIIHCHLRYIHTLHYFEADKLFTENIGMM